MLSINYAKKNGSGYVISFYADTVEDITNFDPTKSFGIYGIPQKGSIITLVSGTDSVNYYLGDSGEIVKIEVGGDEPTPSTLTPFEGGQTITGIDFGNVQNGATSDALETLLATYEGTDGGFFSCNSEGLMGGSGLLYWFVGENNYTVLYASTSDVTGTAGFQNLTNGKFILPESATITQMETDFVSDDWNGVLMGAVVSE